MAGADVTLTPQDAPKIADELSDGKYKARVLGYRLKVDPDVVDDILLAYPDPSDQLLHIITAYLYRADHPTWKDFVTALCSPMVGLSALAKRIEQAYYPSTSTLVPETQTTDTDSTVNTTSNVQWKLSSQMSPVTTGNQLQHFHTHPSTEEDASPVTATTSAQQYSSSSMTLTVHSQEEPSSSVTEQSGLGATATDRVADREQSLPVRDKPESKQRSQSQVLQTATSSGGPSAQVSSATSSDTVLKLTINDTHTVYEMMYEVSEKWQNIGGAFCVPQRILDDIDTEKISYDDKLRRVIIERLKALKDLTWKEVADVLRSITVDQPKLAEKVEHKYLPNNTMIPPSAVVPASDTASSKSLTLSTHQGKSLASVPITTMSVGWVKALERRISRDDTHLQEQYSFLLAITQTCLDDNHCGVDQLITCVMDVRHIKDLELTPLPEVRAATTISGVFLELVIRNLISFLQFSILHRIIKVLCSHSKRLQDSLKEYEERYAAYLKRRVCETHVFHEGRVEEYTRPLNNDEVVELVIFTNETWDPDNDFLRVKDLERVLEDCFKLEKFSLQLVKIEYHCLVLHYMIFTATAKAMFPLTKEEWKMLVTKYGITKIVCMEHIYLDKLEDCEKAVFYEAENSLDHLIQFGESLGMERGELEKLWDKVLGRYPRAVQSLVMTTLLESQSAVDKLSTVVSQMRTTESSITAALIIRKVVMTVECLTVLLKDETDILPIGRALSIEESTLAAIDSYYDDITHKISHTVSLWLMEEHEDPVTEFADALNSLGKEQVSQTLILLTSLRQC